MIAKLKGLLDSVGEDWAIIDVGGVGYLVFCSGRTLGRMPGVGEAVSLLIETHVREDHIHLYGFADQGERDWYKLLTTVQGVGAKVGLALLTVLEPAQLAQAIAAQDKAAVARANGVGPKLAGRIVSELKDKAGAVALGGVTEALAVETSSAGGAIEEAVSALVNLGYGRTEAFTVVAQKAKQAGDTVDVGALIGAALKDMGSGQ